MILHPSILRSFMYEINTLKAIIIRLALKQHENRNFDMQVMPDNNEVLAQELSDDILRALKSNKRRKKVVALLRRNAPLVED